MDPLTFTGMPRGTDQPITIDLPAPRVQLQAIPDPRKRRGVRYPLAVLAPHSVASQVHHSADWAHERAAEPAQVFGLSRTRMPHPTTWRRVLGFGVAAAAIDTAVAPLLQPVPSPAVAPRASPQVAPDGKTIPARTGQGVQPVSAYRVTRQVTLQQVAVPRKANELTVAPILLTGLPLAGVIVTGDAMSARRDLSIQLVEAGGDSCWIVKENRKPLYDGLRLLFGPQPEALPGTSLLPDDVLTVRMVERTHGRWDERVITTSSLLADDQGWPYLAQAFQVVRTTERSRRCAREVRYGITSAPATALPAGDVLTVVRRHWQIESGLHYRRDATLDEDASPVRRGAAPQVVARPSNLVGALAARAGVTNLTARQRALAATVDRWLFRP